MMVTSWSTFQKAFRSALEFVFLLWLAHALGYLVHEYAHSFVAWALGYKANPLALNYGHLSWSNVLTLSDIDENVDYDPIFASGHGPLAALIAVAGVLFGNGLFYLLSRRLYTRAKERGRRTLALFMFLFCMMNAGNFISYVPARTFTTHADMFTVQRGLNISPWWIALVLGIPFCVVVWHFVHAAPAGSHALLLSKCKTRADCSACPQRLYVLCVLRRRRSPSLRTSLPLDLRLFGLRLFPLSILLCWPRRITDRALQHQVTTGT